MYLHESSVSSAYLLELHVTIPDYSWYDTVQQM